MRFRKKLSICLIGLYIVCVLSSCSKIPFLSHSTSSSSTSSASISVPYDPKYKSVTVKTLCDELENNALRAERTYLGADVAISGKIRSIDINGEYFTIIDSSTITLIDWLPDTVYCSITNESQLNVLLEKNEGDSIIVCGQISSIENSLGPKYYLALDEIVISESEND